LGDSWAKSIRTNKEEEDSATIPYRPKFIPGGSDAPQLGVSVDAKAHDDPITEDEHQTLGRVRSWVRDEKIVNNTTGTYGNAQEGGGKYGGNRHGGCETAPVSQPARGRAGWGSEFPETLYT